MAKEKKQKERKLLEPVNDDAKQSKFARALGSTDHATREAGLRALTVWLAGHKNITENDLLRLWKALFYCFWHSDKTALAERLSEIMTHVPPAVGELYFKVFVHTLRREWFGIDRHRMDKFLMMIRKFYAQHLRYLQSSGWDAELLEEFAEFWTNEVLLPKDTLPASGFAYHIADLVLPELNRVVSESGTPPSNEVLVSLLTPFCATAAETRNGVMVRRLYEGLFEGIAKELEQPEDPDALKNLDGQAFSEVLFELGARQEMRAANREALYQASQEIEGAAQTRSALNGEKKKKKKDKKKEAVAMEVEEAPVEKKSSSKKRKSTDGAAGEPAVVANGHAASAEKPKSSKKSKSAATSQPAELPASDSKKQKSGKKCKTPVAATAAAVQAAEAGANDVTPVQSPQAAARGDNRPKSVRFSLKRNLVNVIGQPPLPEDIRTPPTAKPKGSALKVKGNAVRSLSNLGKPPGSAPPKMQGSGGKSKKAMSKKRSPVGTRSAVKAKNAPRTLPSPGSVRRPKAADFF